MGNDVYESQKRTLKHSKAQIDKAAQNIRHGCVGEDRDSNFDDSKFQGVTSLSFDVDEKSFSEDFCKG